MEWEMENMIRQPPGREKLGAEVPQRCRTEVCPRPGRRSACLEHRGEGGESMDLTGPKTQEAWEPARSLQPPRAASGWDAPGQHFPKGFK